MTIGSAPLCAVCTRLDRESPRLVCEAYPEIGIPDEILAGADHRVARGDEEVAGVVFEADPRRAKLADSIVARVAAGR